MGPRSGLAGLIGRVWAASHGAAGFADEIGIGQQRRGGSPFRQIRTRSGFPYAVHLRITVENGASVRETDCAKPSQGMLSASRPLSLPRPLPP